MKCQSTPPTRKRVVVRRITLAAAAALFIFGLTVGNRPREFVVVAEEQVQKVKELFLRPLPADNVSTLAAAVDSEWLARKSGVEVPNAAPQRFPGGLDQMGVAEKKTLFFRSILPHVLQVNANIRERRDALEKIAADLDSKGPLKDTDAAFVEKLIQRYRTTDDGFDWSDLTPREKVAQLLLRVDEVPPSLALAQAAIESAWGSSRFAIEGNNIFGIWVFSATKGMIPAGAAEGDNFGLARYDSITESVESYFRNLNTLWAYEDFRAIRAKLRQGEGRLDSEKLAEGLVQYSVRRDEYVQDVLNLIKTNRLTRFDESRLIDTTTPAAEKSQPKPYGPIRTSSTDA